MSGPSEAFGKDVRQQQDQHGGSPEKSEREKMLCGEPYLAMVDAGLLRDRLRARRILQKYNNYPWPESDDDYFGPDDRRQLLADLFGITLDEVKSKPIEIEPPLWLDYGTNITFKGSFYCNWNCTFVDCAQVTIGDRVLFGPSVHIYAGTHSVELDERQAGYERAYPIEIGDDCWVGGNAVIIGPSKIGKGVTVAANACVRGDFPDYCVIGGTPARILKRLEPPSGKVDLSKYR